MKDLECKLPEWKCQNGYTTLTIYNTKQVITLNERSLRFLHSLNSHSSFTRKNYLSFLKDDVSDKTAKNDIASMVAGGWCVSIGKGPSTKYNVTDKQLPDNAR